VVSLPLLRSKSISLPGRHETCLANIAFHIELQCAQSEYFIAYGTEAKARDYFVLALYAAGAEE
jgi:hypothetical protein